MFSFAVEEKWSLALQPWQIPEFVLGILRREQNKNNNKYAVTYSAIQHDTQINANSHHKQNEFSKIRFPNSQLQSLTNIRLHSVRKMGTLEAENVLEKRPMVQWVKSLVLIQWNFAVFSSLTVMAMAMTINYCGSCDGKWSGWILGFRSGDFNCGTGNFLLYEFSPLCSTVTNMVGLHQWHCQWR